MVVLDEVSNKPLVLGLFLKEDSETERVEKSPSESVEEVGDEERSTGERGEEHGTEGVGEEKDEGEIGSSVGERGGTEKRRSSAEQTRRDGKCRAQTRLKRSMFFKTTTSFLKNRW